MYASGRYVPRNMNKAFKWWKKAAEQGHPVAQYNLGLMYEHGTVVTKNTKKALEWYEKSAAQDNEKAIKAVSDLLDDGKS